MNRLGKIITGVLFTIPIIWGSSAVEGAEWTLFERTSSAVYYYALDGNLPPGRNIVTLWVRKVYLDGGKRDHAIGELEIDCSRRTYNKIETKVYSKSGTVMMSSGLSTNTLHLRISPGTPMDTLHRTVCSDRL